MSGKAVGWARDIAARDSENDTPELSMLDRFILLLLADHADDLWSCFPGVELLMKETGASRRGVQTARRHLEDVGLVTTIGRAHKSGRQTSNRYYLNAPTAPHMQTGEYGHEASAQVIGGAQSVRGEGAVSARGGRSQCAPGGELSAPLEPSNEPPIDPRARTNDPPPPVQGDGRTENPSRRSDVAATRRAGLDVIMERVGCDEAWAVKIAEQFDAKAATTIRNHAGYYATCIRDVVKETGSVDILRPRTMPTLPLCPTCRTRHGLGGCPGPSGNVSGLADARAALRAHRDRQRASGGDEAATGASPEVA